jgi:hypothetical protein
MQKDVIIIENFYENPLEIRGYALKELKENYYLPYQDNPPTWYSTAYKESNICPFKSSKSLVTTFEKIIGEKIDLEHWNSAWNPNCDGNKTPVSEKSTRWNGSFHFKPICPLEKPGNRVHTHCVNPKNTWNNVGHNNWAGLIYLNPNQPIDAGLMNFIHQGGRGSDHKEYMVDLFKDAEKRWVLVDNFGSLFNRLILQRSGIPHQGANGFSNLLEDGRLFQTFFFKTLDKETIDPIKINL